MSVRVIQQQLKDYRKLLGLGPNKKHVVRRFLPQTTVMLLSPHPDDEILMGGLALRLQNENHCQVINVAVTTGSLSARKKPRRQELLKAIKFLGWRNHFLPEDWKKKEKALKKLVARHRPTLIIAPHPKDRHPTHERTAELACEILKNATLKVAWAEYWYPQKNPSLLLEMPDELVIKQIQALEFHRGEIERNAYHLRLLGWYLDNVRRGSEWLAPNGAKSAPMLAGVLYRFESYRHGKRVNQHQDPFAPAHCDLSDWLT